MCCTLRDYTFQIMKTPRKKIKFLAIDRHLKYHRVIDYNKSDITNGQIVIEIHAQYHNFHLCNMQHVKKG